LSQDLEASIIKALRRDGFKATPQRIAIGQLALSDQSHPRAQEVYEKVNAIYPTVSPATVYRTLQILKDVGLIQELGLPHDQSRFDSTMSPHINLVCMQCGSIKDLEQAGLQDMISGISSSESFLPIGQRFDIYGICECCNKKREEGTATDQSASD